MTKLLQAKDVGIAADALGRGLLVAFPTETVYGLGADASNAAAVARVFEAKGRPAGHPLIVHIASSAGLDSWAVDVDTRARRLAEAFWPGPLTLILRRSDRAASEVTGGRDTIGLRVPDHRLTLDLLARFGGGVAGPSANRFGHVSPTSAQHVLDDLTGRIDYVLDGGPARIGLESTIVEVLPGEPLILLRPGGVSAQAVEAVVGEPMVDGRAGESRAAGMLASHYAPRAPVSVVNALPSPDELPAGAVIITAGQPPTGLAARVISVPEDAEEFGRALYRALREADAEGATVILVKAPVAGDMLPAVLDRLSKAAGPRD